MRKLYLSIAILIFYALSTFGQLVGLNCTHKLPTNYGFTNPNDTIYAYCGKDKYNHALLATLKATPTNGMAPYIFDWQKFDTIIKSYISFGNDSGLTSAWAQLPSGGYKVIVSDANGNKECLRCWVWIDSLSIYADPIFPRLDTLTLDAHISSANSFVYFDPLAYSFVVDSLTTITVCFDAVHQFISDLGFYISGPTRCGFPLVTVGNPIAAANGGNNCNSGDSITNLCFSTINLTPFQGCMGNIPFTLTGNYAWDNSPGPFYGCSVSDSGWTVEIRDCVGSDVGTFIHTSLSFSKNTDCGNLSYTFDSGIINQPIPDNNYSVFAFNLPQQYRYTVTSPLKYNWTISPHLFNLNSPTKQTIITDSIPNQPCWFIINAYDSISGCSAKDSAYYFYQTGIETSNKDCIFLGQNEPNPFSEKTIINYTIPQTSIIAQLVIYDSKGNTIKIHPITQKGKGKITVYADNLSSGLFTYKLVVDGKASRSYKMICSK